MNSIILKEYLENVRSLEEDAYTYSKIIENLEAEKKKVRDKVIYTPPEEPELPSSEYYLPFSYWDYLRKGLSPGFSGFLELLLIIVFIISWVDYGFRAALIIIIFSSIFSFVIIPVCVAYIKFKNEVSDEKWKIDNRRKELQFKYDQSMEEYLEKTAAEDNRYDEEKKITDAYNKPISDHISEARRCYNNTMKTLNALYSLNIIYEKYRGLIPITMFCEYMSAGRRTELEGINGMYDLYEEELRYKVIVDSLSEVNQNLKKLDSRLAIISTQLQGIQRNQTMLYSEVAKGNMIAGNISNDIKRIADEAANSTSVLNSISESNRRIEYASELNALAAESAAKNIASLEKMQKYEFSIRHPSYMP